MKYLFAILMIVAFASCKRDKFYTCVCQYPNDSMVIDNIGRMPENEAYAKCRTYADSLVNCYVEIRK